MISDHASLKCDLEDWFTFHLGGWGSYLAQLGAVGLEGLVILALIFFLEEVTVLGKTQFRGDCEDCDKEEH